MRTLLRILALIAVLLHARASAAQTPDPKRAAELKAQADAAMDAHHYDDAIAGYTRAYETDPNPAFLYNRGKAHEARGEYPQAVEDLETFRDKASPELRAKVPLLQQLIGELEMKVAKVELTCRVDGARVVVGGRVMGVTPLQPFRVNAGKTTVEVLAEGQLPYKRDIELKGGATTAIDIPLMPRTTEGQLAVRTTPTGATILVDERPFGTSPTEGIVQSGNHKVLAHLAGLDDVTTQAVVEPGGRREVELVLRKQSKSMFASPWFWTIAGVIVAGAVVGITLPLVLERGPDNGMGFSPGRVSGP
jgi:hypothetical protein